MKWFTNLKNELLQANRTDLVLRLSAVMFLLHGHTNWSLDVPVRIICTLMLISRGLLWSRVLWTLLAILFISTNANQWFIIDNHKYLMAYWCIVCCLAVWHEKSLKLLQLNARLLIGLTFVFATAWKFISMEYLDGSFLHFTMLTDGRMKVAALLGGNVPLDALDQNYEIRQFLRHFPNPALTGNLLTSTSAHTFALGWSYLTLLVEGLIGLLFVFNPPVFQKYRNFVLIAFIIGTYYLLPVTGFGFLLAVLGLTQLRKDAHPAFFFGYLVTLGLVQFSIVPLDDIVLWWVG